MCGRSFIGAFLKGPKEVGRVGGVNSRSDKAEKASLGQCKGRLGNCGLGARPLKENRSFWKRRRLRRHRGVFCLAWRKLGRPESWARPSTGDTPTRDPPVLEINGSRRLSGSPSRGAKAGNQGRNNGFCHCPTPPLPCLPNHF